VTQRVICISYIYERSRDEVTQRKCMGKEAYKGAYTYTRRQMQKVRAHTPPYSSLVCVYV